VTLHDAISCFFNLPFFHENCFFIVELFVKKKEEYANSFHFAFYRRKVEIPLKKVARNRVTSFFSVRFIV